MSVNPDIISWAREYAGYKPGDERIKKHFPKIDDWESGIARPTYPQLERLADKLKIPVAVFFFPVRPQIEPIEKSFRTLPSAQFDEIPPKIRLLLRKARAFQVGLEELNVGRNPAGRLITRDLNVKPHDSVEMIASRVREYLGISFEIQFDWKDDDGALKAWRKAFFDAGIYVFKDSFGKENLEYSGFSLHDAEFPIIYVNNSTAKTRQIFTLFHELTHLIFRTSGIDKRNDDFVDHLVDDHRKIEIVCNRMAAGILAPDDIFSEVLDEDFGLRISTDDSRAVAAKLAKRFSVSREMIYRKFLDREFISDEEYHQAAREWTNQLSAGGNGGNKYYSWIAYLGREYISLAFERYYQNRISFEQLGDYLDIKPKNLGKLEDYFVRSGS